MIFKSLFQGIHKRLGLTMLDRTIIRIGKFLQHDLSTALNIFLKVQCVRFSQKLLCAVLISIIMFSFV